MRRWRRIRSRKNIGKRRDKKKQKGNENEKENF